MSMKRSISIRVDEKRAVLVVDVLERNGDDCQTLGESFELPITDGASHEELLELSRTRAVQIATEHDAAQAAQMGSKTGRLPNGEWSLDTLAPIRVETVASFVDPAPHPGIAIREAERQRVEALERERAELLAAQDTERAEILAALEATDSKGS